MKNIITLFLISIAFQLSSQAIKYDTIIHTRIYNSYYSNVDRCPVVVTYKLYHGGGDVSREGMSFINDIPTIKTASYKDYAKSGYDKGHMVNAEDFAYDSTLEELTFRYYNCVPQTPELNRGIWKHYESVVRKMSETDSLFIVCYNHLSTLKLRERVSVPDTCYKFVYSLTTHKLLLSIGLPNVACPVKFEPSIEIIGKLEELINFSR